MRQCILMLLLLCSAPLAVSAQSDRFDIVSFIPPAGWKKVQGSGTVAYTSPSAAGGSSCQIVIYTSQPSNGGPRTEFDRAWARIITAGMGSQARPTVEATKRPDGWEIVSGAADITASGATFATVVSNATGSGRSMSFQFIVIGGGTDCAPAMGSFLGSLTFASAAGPEPSVPSIPAAKGAFTYDYIAPAGWTTRRAEGHVRLESPAGSCVILIFPPQRSTGNLQRDAAAAFDQMYGGGWQPQKFGEQRYTLSKGVLPGGQEFFMMEAAMKKPSADGTLYDGFEDGVALVVRAGAEIALVVARHNTSFMEHDGCYRRYEAWRRFLNSFAVRNAPALTVQNDAGKNILGRWSMTESGSSGEYVFAANGNYAMIGALGTARSSSDIDYDRLYITTYAFPGDGSYRLAGNQLTLRRRGGAPEQITIRFDQADQGGTGWVDRIHMLKQDAHGQNESTYVKRGK